MEPIRVDPRLRERVERWGPLDLNRCLSCGQCTALCPVGLPLLPRTLFRYLLLGSVEGLTEAAEPLFSCLLCGMCEVHCPHGVSIADNIRAIRAFLLGEIVEVDRP